jgi:hypothetical protein
VGEVFGRLSRAELTVVAAPWCSFLVESDRSTKELGPVLGVTAIGVTRLALAPLVWICYKLRELVVVAVEGNGPILVQSSWARADRQRSCRHRVRDVVITVVVVVGASWGGPKACRGSES